MSTFGNALGRELLAATLITAALALGGAAVATDATAGSEPAVQLAAGTKMKLKGVVTRRDADTFTVRDMNGVDTVVPK